MALDAYFLPHFDDLPAPIQARVISYSRFTRSFASPNVLPKNELEDVCWCLYRLTHSQNPDIGHLIQFIDARREAYCKLLFADVNSSVKETLKRKIDDLTE